MIFTPVHTDKDIEMASTFDGEVIAFNVPVPVRVSDRAKEEGVVIKQHNIIYRLFDDLKEGLNSKLPRLHEDVVLGVYEENTLLFTSDYIAQFIWKMFHEIVLQWTNLFSVCKSSVYPGAIV